MIKAKWEDPEDVPTEKSIHKKILSKNENLEEGLKEYA